MSSSSTETAERQIDIEPQGERLRISFPYQAEIVDVVRALPQRRWDWGEKAWFVPVQHLEEVVAHLGPYRFRLSEALEAHCAQLGADAQAWIREGLLRWQPLFDPARLPEGTVTVAELNHEVRAVLHAVYPEERWIVGELQGFDRNPRRGHAFFELVERPWRGADPKARLTTVMFAEVRREIERALSQEDEIALRDGLAVRLRGRVDLYTGHGRYQFVVSELDTGFTYGAIEQNRDAVLRRLDYEGILDRNVSLPWPACPYRVGLVTSAESDACHDFLAELRASGLRFEVTLIDARVQGAHTESSVLRALAHFGARASELDVVAIVRGGGARSDLAYFDTDAIGEAVCRHEVKILCGIGHQRDRCLLDMIAHDEMTPTAAAQALVSRVRGYLEAQRDLMRRLVLGASLRGQLEGDRLRRVAASLERAAQVHITRAHARVDRQHMRLDHGVQASVSAQRHRLRRAQMSLDHASALGLKSVSWRLERQADRLRLLDPATVLARGYALVRGADGQAVEALERGDRIEVTLARGRGLRARIEALTPSPDRLEEDR